MNSKYAALAVAAIMLLAGAATIPLDTAAQAVSGQVTFNVLTAEVSPGGFIIFILNNTWLDQEYQLGAGVAGELYIDFDQLERISNVAIPFVAPDARAFANYIDAIYNETSGTGSVGVDPGRIPLTYDDQFYTVIVAQMPKKEYFYLYQSITGNDPFNVPLFIKIWTGDKTIVSKGYFQIRDAALKLTFYYNPAYDKLSFIGALNPFEDGVTNMVRGTLSLTWGDGTPFNFTKYTSDGHYLNVSVAMVNVDYVANNYTLLNVSFQNQAGTIITDVSTEVLYSGTNMITVDPDTTTADVNDKIGNFTVYYSTSKSVNLGVELPYADFNLVMTYMTNIDGQPYIIYFDQVDRNVTWTVDPTTNRIYGIYINISNAEDSARGVNIIDKQINFTESAQTYAGDLLGFGNLTNTARTAEGARGILQLEWYKNTDAIAGISGFAGNLMNNTFYVQFYFTLTSQIDGSSMLRIYPSVEITGVDHGGPAATIVINYGIEYNVGDNVTFVAHHLPYNASEFLGLDIDPDLYALDGITLFQYDPVTGMLTDGIEMYTLINTSVTPPVLNVPLADAINVSADGTLTYWFVLTADKPYNANYYYLVVRVAGFNVTNETLGTVEVLQQVNTWPKGMGVIYPILYQHIVQPNGLFATDNVAGLGDYIHIIGVGFDFNTLTTDDLVFYFYTADGDRIPISVLMSDIAGGLLIRSINSTAFEAVLRIPYEGYLATNLAGNFNGVLLVSFADNPLIPTASTEDLTVATDGSEAKIFAFPAEMPYTAYINWTGVVLPSAITNKYPYEAYVVIDTDSLMAAGYTEDDFMFYVEIIGAPYARLFVDTFIRLNGTTSGYSSFVTGDAIMITGGNVVNGYATVVLKIPTIPFDAYTISLESTPITTVFTVALNNDGLEMLLYIDCIVAVKALTSGKPEVYMVPGTYAPDYDVHVLQDGIINVIGFGFASNELVTFYTLGLEIDTIETEVDGTFNATIYANRILLITGVYTGFYDITVMGETSACAETFIAWIEEIPRLVVTVDGDKNVFPGELATIVLKVAFQYTYTETAPNLTAAQDLYALNETMSVLKLVFYRPSTDDVAYTITKPLTMADFTTIINEGYFNFMGMNLPAEYYPDVGIYVIRLALPDFNKSVVVAVSVQIDFVNGISVTSSDFTVLSLEDYLYGTLEAISFEAITGAIIAEIRMAVDNVTENITVQLDALRQLVENGFDNVQLAIADNVTEILTTLAILEVYLSDNFTEVRELIMNSTEDILEAIENINVTGTVDVNLTEVLTAIDLATQQILAAIDFQTLTLEIAIQQTGDAVVNTILGQLQLTSDQLARLISEAQMVTLEAINDQTMTLTAYIDAGVMTLQENLTSVAANLQASVLGAIADAVDTVKAEITLAAGKVIFQLTDVVNAAAGTVVGQVYLFLFGEEMPIATTAQLSVKGLIEASTNATLTAIDESTATITAAIGDTRTEIVTAIDDSTNTISNAITQATTEISDTVKSEVSSARQAITDAVNSKGDEITSNLSNKIDSAVNTITSNVQSALNEQKNTIDSVNANVNGVKTIAIVNAVLILITLLVVAVLFIRSGRAIG